MVKIKLRIRLFMKITIKFLKALLLLLTVHLSSEIFSFSKKTSWNSLVNCINDNLGKKFKDETSIQTSASKDSFTTYG